MENLKKWRKILEFCISVGLLGLVISQIGNADWLKLLLKINLEYLFLSLLAFFIGICFNTFKWRMLARSIGINVSFVRAFQFYMIGSFLNTFLPVGSGDIKRVCDLSKDNSDYLGSFISVVMERWTGFLALIIIAMTGLLMQYRYFQKTQYPSMLTLIFLAGIIVTVIMFCSVKKFTFLRKFEKLRSFSENYERIALSLQHNRGLVLQAFILSFPQPLIVILYFFLLSRSLSLNFPFETFLFTVPFILIISQLPISIGGLGVQEACFLAVFAPLNMDMSSVFSLSILSHIGKFLSALLGALYYSYDTLSQVKEPLRKKREIAKDEAKGEAVFSRRASFTEK